MYKVLEETHNGYEISIVYDDDPINPRTEYENMGTMVCFHRRYKLGDDHGLSIESAKELMSKVEKSGGVVLPLFLYNHSGITMNTTGFSCPWDSGQVGFIYVDAETIRKEYNVKRISKRIREKVTDHLKCEVEIYDRFLTGEVYGFIIEKDGEKVDSFFGYFYEPEQVLKEAIAAVT